MPATSLSFRVHYLNVQPSDALSAAIEQGLARLAPHRDRVAHCNVHVGRWIRHHELPLHGLAPDERQLGADDE